MVARCGWGPYEGSNDAIFISHSPADIAYLLGEVERLRENRDFDKAAMIKMSDELVQRRASIEHLEAVVAAVRERLAASDGHEASYILRDELLAALTEKEGE